MQFSLHRRMQTSLSCTPCVQRSDCEVLDEPLYASFLKLTGSWRPYREQVRWLQQGCRSVFRQCVLLPSVTSLKLDPPAL